MRGVYIDSVAAALPMSWPMIGPPTSVHMSMYIRMTTVEVRELLKKSDSSIEKAVMVLPQMSRKPQTTKLEWIVKKRMPAVPAMMAITMQIPMYCAK